MGGVVIGLAVSPLKGTRKRSVKSVKLVDSYGVEGDAHGGTKREVSLLSVEERDRLTANKSLKPGDAAENILIKGLENLSKVSVGTFIRIGDIALLRVVQIGKEYHSSPIHEYTGYPVLPSVGVFCSVERGGIIRIGDKVETTLSQD